MGSGAPGATPSAIDERDGLLLLAAVRGATAHLAAHVHEVDALNVFPVPDGDTGTNMLATMRAALAEADALTDGQRDVGRVTAALSLGALMGARGNSGVILSQILRGGAEATRDRTRADGRDLADALQRGSAGAFAAIAAPVEGTILTVIRETAAAAAETAADGGSVAGVLAASVLAAQGSVARTPSLLAILAEAGVVDSGGQGLFLLLEGALRSLHDTGPEPEAPVVVRPHLPPAGVHFGDASGDHAGEAYGFETTYLVTAADQPIDIDAVRRHLEAMGGSIGVAGDDHMIRVHIHNEDPDGVVAYGRTVGTVDQIRIEDLDRQADEMRAATTSGLAVVAVAQGEGLERVLVAAGAAAIVSGPHGRPPSAGELARAIRETYAADVIVLPNDSNIRLVAEQAARLVPNVNVSVVPTRNAAEGVAALLALDAHGSAAENAALMLAAARSVQTVAVTEAVRDARIGGRSVLSGETIALAADGTLIAVAADRLDATVAAVRALRPGFELLTVYAGRDAERAEADELARRLRAALVAVEVEVVMGGQPHYPFLIVAE